MKLEEAIEVFGRWIRNEPVIPASKLHVAARLLIGAGERIEEYRKVVCTPVGSPLPGETKATIPSHRLPLGGITIKY